MYYMSEFSTITSKGTITIPAKFRAKLGFKPGQKVQLSLRGSHVEVERTSTWEDLAKLREKLTKQIPAGVKPVTNVSQAIAELKAAEYKLKYGK